MEISTDQIKALREQTGVSVMQCRKALEEANGDMEKAVVILRKKSSDIAAKKSDRTLAAGTIASYLHGAGTVGVLVELSCETDFVSGNPEFKALAYDIAMHIAASKPEFVRVEEITEDMKAKAREVFTEEAKSKPEKIRAQIVDGKLAAYFNEKVLLEQPFIKNPDVTVGGLILAAVQKFGEKIEVARFVRYSVLGK
ncbi:MAG: hypothetical protein RLZZ347_876 [Candidatus Parcubacteria bacterium]|jgi:elongation factor Ts